MPRSAPPLNPDPPSSPLQPAPALPESAAADGTLPVLPVARLSLESPASSEPLSPPAPVSGGSVSATRSGSGGEAPRGRERTGIRARVRTFSCTDRDMEMLERIAEYHGFSKSAMIASLVRREFWRIFPSGTPELRPDPGARIDD